MPSKFLNFYHFTCAAKIRKRATESIDKTSSFKGAKSPRQEPSGGCTETVLPTRKAEVAVAHVQKEPVEIGECRHGAHEQKKHTSQRKGANREVLDSGNDIECGLTQQSAALPKGEAPEICQSKKRFVFSGLLQEAQ